MNININIHDVYAVNGSCCSSRLRRFTFFVMDWSKRAANCSDRSVFYF